MELSLELWSERFCLWLRLRNQSGETVSCYRLGLRQFFAYLESLGVSNIKAINRDLVEGYRGELYQRRYRGKPLTASTQTTRLGAVKSFLRYLYKENFLLMDVGAGIEFPKKVVPLPKVLSEDEMLKLLGAPDVTSLIGIRDRAMLEVFYCSAIRNGELGGLDLGDIDWERQALWIREGKGKKSRLVPLGEEALAWLEEYLTRVRPQFACSPQQHRLFLSAKGLPLLRSAIAAIVKRWSLAAGLTGVHTHTLRHSCATHMMRRGAGIRHLQTLLGHSSPLTTELYTKVELTDLHKVLRRCHPREKAFGS
jgi:integrase/recombinase XerD